MIDESFYAYGTLDAPQLEFMTVNQQMRPAFLAPCGLGSKDEKKLIALSPKDHPVIKEIENAIESQLDFGKDLKMSVVLFDSKEDILEYTADPDYELIDDKPAICFGVSLEIKNGDKYDAYYHFID